MVALKRGKTIDFSDCDRYNSDCFECHQWLPFSHIPRVTGQRHAWQSTHRAAPMQTGHYARSADSFLGDHSGDHAQRVRARRFCLRAARDRRCSITASIAQCSQRATRSSAPLGRAQRPVSGQGDGLEAGGAAAWKRAVGRRGRAGTRPSYGLSDGLAARPWRSYDGDMPARRRIIDIQESHCHGCGSPLTWVAISDVLVGSTSGVASDREASASPAHFWETACGVCGQTYMTAAAE